MGVITWAMGKRQLPVVVWRACRSRVSQPSATAPCKALKRGPRMVDSGSLAGWLVQECIAYGLRDGLGSFGAF